MTSRRTILASLFSFSLTAADFWQTKKSSEWTDKELSKILNDSPWSRQTAITMGQGSKGGGGGGEGRGSSGGGGSRGGGMSSGGMSGGGGKGGRGGEGGGGGGGMPSISLQIRWATAKPVKLAVARLKFGAEAESKPEVKELVNRVEKDYVITIEGIPPNMARQGVEKLASSLKMNCAMHCAGKDDLTPSDAQVVQGERGITAVVTFPKKDPFSLDDKEVEFAMKLGNNTAKRKFKLKDMVFDGKLEL
jgi:translation initiation factor 1 (eIF-1/SUI1)